jgi:branched-chain amino acid transport system substrate-binding protein
MIAVIRAVPARLLSALVIVASVAVAAGCGSGSSSTTTAASAGSAGTSSQAASTSSKPTGSPIVIGTIYDITQPGSPARSQTFHAIQARVDAINASGGIKGHPVKLVTCDSKASPTQGAACAKKMVSSGAVAVVGMVAIPEAAITPILDRAGIPSIGAFPASAAVGNSPNAFCFMPGLTGQVAGIPEALKSVGATNAAMLYPSNVGPLSVAIADGWKLGLKKSGLSDGGLAGFPIASTQFDAPVAKAVSHGADGVLAFGVGGGTAVLLKSVLQQSPNAKVAAFFTAPGVLQALGSTADGMVSVSLNQPYTATSVPGIKMFDADMDRNGRPNTFAERDQDGVNAWAAAYAFQQVAEKLPEVTRSSLLAAMENVQGLSTGGIYPPLSADTRKQKLASYSCVMNGAVVLAKVQDGKLVAVDPGKFYNPFG